MYESDEYLEGARMYNIRGVYYIWLTRPFGGQYVLKSASGPLGPYECRQVIGNIHSPIPGAGSPHQGALVDAPDGRWYYMAFMDGWPGGRVPVLAPVTFDDEGWPKVDIDQSVSPGAMRTEYPIPIQGGRPVQRNTCLRTHSFDHDVLEPCWQWNHNPDNSKWSMQNGRPLILSTGSVTNNLHLATNTLTHRIIGPKSTATFCLDISRMKDGDRAGSAMFCTDSAYIGVYKDAGASRLVYVEDLVHSAVNLPVGWMNGHPIALDWSAKSDGTIKAETSIDTPRVWLRVKADISPAFAFGYEKETRFATFEYSFDGQDFSQLGSAFALSNDFAGFVAYRFAVFNWATIALGGQLLVESCDIQSLS